MSYVNLVKEYITVMVVLNLKVVLAILGGVCQPLSHIYDLPLKFD